MSSIKDSSQSPVKALKKARRSRPYHHGDLRTSLISAALTLIDEHGIKGFSLTDAAKIAGVSVAAPYRHFADKQSLLLAIASQGFHLFNAELKAAFDKASTPETRIIELGVAYVLFAHRYPAYVRVMFAVESDPAPVNEAPTPDGFALLFEAVTQVDPNASHQERMDRVVASWSIVHGFALLSLDGAFHATFGLTDPEPQLRRCLTLMLPHSAAPWPPGPQPGKRSRLSRSTSKAHSA